MPRFVSVGECIVELVGDAEAGYRLSYDGFARDMALRMRGHLGPDWTVDLFTALGDDIYSQHLVDDLAKGGVGVRHILKIPGRAIGLSLVDSEGENGPTVTDWRSQSEARLMADDRDAMAAAFANAEMIYVSGSAFGILLPRARGRLLQALHRAREAGSRIAFAPHEAADLWTSRRVQGSVINAVAMVSDIVLTATGGENATYGDVTAEAIAARYREWGVEEVLVRKYREGVFLSSPAGGRWVTTDAGPAADHLNSAYLASRANGASPEQAVASFSGGRIET